MVTVADPQESIEAIEGCACGRIPCLSAAKGKKFNGAQVICVWCGRRGPTAQTEWLAIKLWNNDHPLKAQQRQKMNNPLSNPDSIGQTDWIEDLSSKEMTWDYCPSCAGELDTGFECNQCGRDWRPWATAYLTITETENEQ